MKHRVIFTSLTTLLIFFVVTAFSSRAGYAQPTVQITEFWRILSASVRSAPIPSSYNTTVSLLSPVSGILTSPTTLDSDYWFFQPPALSRTVDSAKYFVMEQTGSYPGTITLALEVIDIAGNLQHTVSTIDLNNVVLNNWNSFSLSTIPNDLVVNPGEVLAIHINYDAGSVGDLTTRIIFEITVTGELTPTSVSVPEPMIRTVPADYMLPVGLLLLLGIYTYSHTKSRKID